MITATLYVIRVYPDSTAAAPTIMNVSFTLY